ncbi:cytochrome c oxidase mono-heme subunit : Cytochrome C oxidase mono-heme subunit/FixO OS=Isosphaera pallida (strain ATCC 43644 / DSM 9630 / IS1B) GN=Isop_0397 PE=4 SV=1: FixO [Gemmataceae bacterium]|nr:cytochrome c oxidase mono-heme subunit : Cytochrome C oxidase mono-heme subunit/FixO OS=Isosphaera pallida (strain ATCC 43644 / DSM 9630 / IS1B) GN=Isop_0397 PE=4 SV=1: FixO [Gemmataceae bacterium]VTU02206.1 cytochrome c oxidase mono-heme subunit : Cytochrome C oxidase mono-heme subunit/FixO OS=Isosphaera pallida (strain ATCC 43644 / DSM 9630 / IS1B) GN=Isop_0397 PE=4 SV=1: FixO [Gemmataceae bacterium]
MDRGMVIFVGALLTFSSSWLGLVLFPFWQLNGEQPYRKDAADDPYPLALQGTALAGQKVYQREGCMYCHSQQVRSEKFGNWWDEHGQERTGADVKRGWGQRRTVSRDYIYDRPTMLGTMRTGPDLANVGGRYSEAWQHAHTFNPRVFNDWSVMPSFPWLYRKEKVVGERSERALKLGREWTVDPGYRWRPSAGQWDAILRDQGEAITARFLSDPAHSTAAIDPGTADGKKRLLDFWLTTEEEGVQIVPTGEGEALVAYLLALRKAEVPLPEAKE